MQRSSNLCIHEITRHFIKLLVQKISTFVSIALHNSCCWVFQNHHGVVFFYIARWSGHDNTDWIWHAIFFYLLNLFAPVYDQYTPFVDEDGFIVCKVSMTKGRPRLMNPADCLGLVLAWSRTRGSLMVLQLIFGLTMSPVAKYLQFACRILVKILKANDLAKIKIPPPEKLEEYRAIMHHVTLLLIWYGVPWMAWSAILKKLPMTLSNLNFSMGGNWITMPLQC